MKPKGEATQARRGERPAASLCVGTSCLMCTRRGCVASLLLLLLLLLLLGLPCSDLEPPRCCCFPSGEP